MNSERAFVALGTDRSEPGAVFAAALASIQARGARVIGAARIVSGPWMRAEGTLDVQAPEIHNTVAELSWAGSPEDLLEVLLGVEAQQGRVRGATPCRALDLDLLALGSLRREGSALTLPHAGAPERAFVLAPWEELAPEWPLVGPNGVRMVVEHSARLRARAPGHYAALRAHAPPALPALSASVVCLYDARALSRWRAAQSGHVGVVPTMGALHAGHGSLVRRAAAECDVALATLFVNPLQFGPGEDLARYPRTLERDVALLAAAGAQAVYVPEPHDLFPRDYSTFVVPEGMDRWEGAARPGHFRGVATVVTKLLQRTRPTRAYFGRKDAQQLAMVRRLVRDLDLCGEVVPCATVRDDDGMALSSRNRFLTDADRQRARGLSQALGAMVDRAAAGERSTATLCRELITRLEGAGLSPEYAAVVDAESFSEVAQLAGPALMVAAARVGSLRLLDNRWIAVGREGGA